VVGHDWGSIIGWYLCQLRPDRVKGYVAVAVPVIPRGPGEASWEQQWRSIVGDGFYICRFQVSMNSNALRLLFVTLSPGSNTIWERHPIDMSNDLIVPCSEENLNFQCLTSVQLIER
jgi:pimeloyl-ACP methyl ester carboxylesterase